MRAGDSGLAGRIVRARSIVRWRTDTMVVDAAPLAAYIGGTRRLIHAVTSVTPAP